MCNLEQHLTSLESDIKVLDQDDPNIKNKLL